MKSQPSASLLLSARLQSLMNSALIAYHVNVIREDRFLCVLSIHINTILRTHTHPQHMCVAERERDREREGGRERDREGGRKEKKKENIVEQLPKTPKGLDCSLLIPLSQHVPMLKYHSFGLVVVLSLSTSC